MANKPFAAKTRNGSSLFSVARIAQLRCFQAIKNQELKDSEVEGGAKATVLAKDGIAVIVSNDNPTDNLTVDQIKGIYTGELTTWADVQ